ncbi:tyrosine recombinase XerC [Microbacterium sp. NPDC087665]|uniref:site-specific integrase n=1 Tax=Microbacterium sp. NPDC087665 TaxID=3364194 RepID=UPI00382E8BA2
MALTISPEWARIIDDYALHLAAADRSPNTIRARREQLQHLARRIGVAPEAVTSALLLRFVGGQTWQTETRRSRYSGLREFFKWARRVGWIEKNPAKHLPTVKPAEPNPDPVPRAVFDQSVRRVDERTALMMRLAHDAGLRRGEIAVVHSDDLRQDLLGWSLLVHGKGRRKRIVPLTPRLALDLRALTPGYAFPGAIDGHLSPRRVGELLRDAIPGHWTGHKLRHSFGTNVNDETEGDVMTVGGLLGHRNLSTVPRYVKPSDFTRRKAVYGAAGYPAPERPIRHLEAI